MSFPESSKPRDYHCIGKYKKVFHSFWTFRLWQLEYFDLDAKSLWNGRELGAGSSAWILQLSIPGSQAASALVVKDTVCPSLSIGAVLCPLPPHPCLFCRWICCWCIFFDLAGNGQGWGFLWKALHGESSQGTFSTIAPIGQGKSSWKVAKARHLGTLNVLSFAWSQQV